MICFFASLIHFISCHGGPANHFAEFIPVFTQQNHTIEVFATGPALDQFQKRKIFAQEFNSHQLNLDDPETQELLAQNLVKHSQSADLVITDLGHPLMVRLHQLLGKQNIHYAYYDNPESFVPGGYSLTAAEVMNYADKVLFANTKLAQSALYKSPNEEIHLPYEKRYAIGYYPIEEALRIKKNRQEKSMDPTHKTLFYFGGNNEEYYTKAFPAFLHLLTELTLPEHYEIFLQQHPGAKKENRDKELAQSSCLHLSSLSSEEALSIADAVFYFQTSMAPQFVLAGIPTFQIGHEPYPDLLIRNNMIPSITTTEQLKGAILGTLSSPLSEDVWNQLGISIDWKKNLENLIVD